MKNVFDNKSIYNYLIVGFIWGVLFFYLLYGIKILDPTYLDWIYCDTRMDLFKQQIGFEFFLKSDWRFPIGTYVGYRYPCINTIIESDFLPLLGLFFKLIRFWLPEHFTYLAWWIFLCMVFQGMFGALILRRLGINLIATSMSLPLFFCNVVLFRRVYGHLMLCGHFLILMAFLICLYEDRIERTSKANVIWASLNVLALATHPYLFVMVGIIFISYLLYDYLNKKNWERSIKILTGSVISVFLLWYLLGGFIITTPSAGGLGMYSMNLNAIINPISGSSRFLKELPTINPSVQWEGEAYLGLGILISLILTIPYSYSFVRDKEVFTNKKNSRIAIGFFVAACVILSLSPVISLGSKEIMNYLWIPFVKVLEPIRATGRFFWPVLYTITIFVIYRIYYSEKRIVCACVIFALVSLIQFADLSVMVNHGWRKLNFTYEESNFSKSLKDLINSNAKHFELIPNRPDHFYGDLALFADYHDMTMNIAYMTRSHGNPYIKELVSQIESRNFREDTLYCVPFSNGSLIMKIPFLDDKCYVKAADYLIIYDKSLSRKAPPPSISIDEHALKLLKYSHINLNNSILLTGKKSDCLRIIGLSHSEKDFAWTDGKKVTMMFYFNDEEIAFDGFKKCRAKINLKAVYTGSQKVIIFVNGKIVENTVINNGENLQFGFDMPKDGFVKIEIEIPNAISPLERGESKDSRILGLGMKDMLFTKID